MLQASFVSLFVWQAVALRFVYIVGGLRYSVTPPSPMRMLLFGWGIGMLVLGFLVIYQFAAEDLVDNVGANSPCPAAAVQSMAACAREPRISSPHLTRYRCVCVCHCVCHCVCLCAHVCVRLCAVLTFSRLATMCAGWTAQRRWQPGLCRRQSPSQCASAS